jgi:hypothetical protein
VIITINLRKYHFKQHSSGTKIISLIIVNFVTPKNGAKLLFNKPNCAKQFPARRWFAEYKSDSSSTPSVTKSIALEIMNLVTPRVEAFVQQTDS